MKYSYKLHSMACEYPEGCSCGVLEWNSLIDELIKLEEDRKRLDWLNTREGMGHMLCRSIIYSTPEGHREAIDRSRFSKQYDGNSSS